MTDDVPAQWLNPLITAIQRVAMRIVCLFLLIHSPPGLTVGYSSDATEFVNHDMQTSLFDELFGVFTNGAIKHQIPYPFEQLTSSLSDKLRGCNSRGAPPYANVLVPIGRSQQFAEEGLKFFRYPRIILGIDTESCERRLSKDRLFIAYQETSQTIEVISYNERSGRFEFQIVENYNDSHAPIVRNARRERCLQCHQNGAAIFPQFNWSETNFNPRIAADIGKHHRKFHGIGTDQLSAKAGRLDGSTDRANLISAYQQIWRNGCAMATRTDSLRCRAGIFESMLKRRLGFVTDTAADHNADSGSFRQLVRHNWLTSWPDGLPVPNPDLPNPRRQNNRAYSGLSDKYDPRTTRPPRAFWRPHDDMERVLKGMAESFLLQQDINRVDNELSRLSYRYRGYRQSYQGACTFDRVQIRGDTWIDTNCEVSTGGLDKSRLSAQLYPQRSNTVHPGLSGMYLTDSNPGFITHASLSGTVTFNPTGVSTARLSARKRYQMIRARARDGQAMSTVEFAWDERFAEPIPGGLRFLGRVRLALVNDSKNLTAAIEQMIEDADSLRFDGFDDKPLRGVVLMDAFFAKLAPVHLSQTGPGLYSEPR